MANYFENFGIQQYGETSEVSRKLTTRANIAQSVISKSRAFYPYTIKAGERPDTLSYMYYKKPDLEWLIFFANDIIDPYYDWHLADDAFNSFIVNKYGSIAQAQTKTKHYEVVWAGDDSRISIDAYTLLTANTTVNLKKYWEPVVDEMDRATSYRRKKLEAISSTNRIINIPVGSINGTFVTGEDIYQESSGVITAAASLVTANTTYFTAQHVVGSFDTTKVLLGSESQANAAVTSTPTTLVVNIPTEELVYWQAVSFYDYEAQLNEKRKNIKLINSEYAAMAENDLTRLMA